MILDWRSRRYRGGSGWFQSGIVSVSVGVALGVVPQVISAIDVPGQAWTVITVEGAYQAAIDVPGEAQPVITIEGEFE